MIALTYVVNVDKLDLMYSLSTCWFSSRGQSGEDIVAEALRLGFNALEIGYGLQSEALPGITRAAESGQISISSLHAFTAAFGGEGGHPERYNLSDIDEEKRKIAVERLRENLEYAKALNVPVVVVHAGRIMAAARHWLSVHDGIMNDRNHGFFFKRRLRKMVALRAESAPKALEALLHSLEEILPEFEEAGIKLAIENLPSYDAIPQPEEIEFLTKKFSSSAAYALWFDMGHAQVMENAGYGDAVEAAKRDIDHIVGLHIHDVIGPAGDHQAPGFGGVDFRAFSFLRDKISVFEPSPTVLAEDLGAAVRFLNEAWRI